MVRTVRVRLELDREDFQQGLADAAAETRAFDGEVRGLGNSAERTGVEMKDSSAAAKKLGDDACSSARDVDAMGVSMRGAGDEVRNTGEELDVTKDRVGELARGHQALDEALQRTRRAAADTRTEFERTGNMNLLADASKLDAQVKKLEQYKTSLNGIEREVENISLGPLSLPPQALIPAAAVLAPFLGAAISGAISLAGIAGILAAGIYGAAQDQRVRFAFGQLGGNIKADLASSAQGLVDPLVRAASTIDVAFHSIDLRGIFNDVAPAVDKLAAGVAGMIRNLGPGLEGLARNSEQFVTVLADELPRLGTTISGVLDALDRGMAARGAVDGLDLSFTALNGTLGGTGQALADLSMMFEALGGHELAVAAKTEAFSAGLKDLVESLVLGPVLGEAVPLLDRISGSTDKAKSQFTLLKPAAGGAASAIDGVSGAASGAVGPLGALAAITDTYTGSAAAAHVASATFKGAADGLASSLKHNGLAIDSATGSFNENTAAGRANAAAYHEAERRAAAHADAVYQSSHSAIQADAAYRKDIASLDGMMRAAGLSAAQVAAVNSQLDAIPSYIRTIIDVQTVYHSAYTTSYQPGLTPTATALHHRAHGGLVAYAGGGIDYGTDYQARSGILKPSDPGTILAGEPSTGGEVFTPRLGISDDRGLALANVAAGWHGGHVVRDGPRGGDGAVQVNSTLTVAGAQGARPVEQMLATWFMSAVRQGQITLKTDDAGVVRVQ